MMAVTKEMEGAARTRVWDPLVRISHWALAIAFFVAYFTEDDLLTLHVWAGYAAGVLVVTRVVWGFLGPRHARFSEFLYGPPQVWRYLLDLFAFRAKRYLGHSPAGGAMVIALLLGMAATVWSGLELYAVEENAGPLAQEPSPQPVSARLATRLDVLADENDRESKEDDDDEESDGDELWEEVHEFLANLLLVLVVLHIAGVLLASAVHKENLTRSMLTGYKRRD